MIIYDLSCDQNHPFEGWFQSQEDYGSQLERGLIACPHCASTLIRRVPSPIHLARSVPAAEAVTASPVVDVQSGVRAVFQRIVSAIIAGSEDVGNDFVQEARRIHYLEAPSRSIRGEASTDDYELLREEGIDVLRLPVVKKNDLN